MKIAVLLSGGVDSSVALNLLVRAGHDVTAFYLKIWLEDELSFLGSCPWEEDLEYANAVCKQIGVELISINMQAEYLNTVVEYTISELKAGRTPSPDIMCNKSIKFGEFFKKIDSSFDKIASGHYAKVEEIDGKFRLIKAPDPIKDQTYFLTYLVQDQLSKILFPLGEFNKKEVRALADEFELPNRDRPDSQGVCFLGKIKFADFIKFHLGEQKGNIIDLDTQKVLGKHNGYWFHTIGQRQGLGLSGGPWYVVEKDLNQNIIYVSNKNTVEEKRRKDFTLCNLNWIGGIPDNLNDDKLEVKLRHGPITYLCKAELIENNRVAVHLNDNDQGVAPGQFGIFYKGNVCLGGGIIE